MKPNPFAKIILNIDNFYLFMCLSIIKSIESNPFFRSTSHEGGTRPNCELVLASWPSILMDVFKTIS